eukprot:m.70470 g.70470  ORF g.70470 m.70470 type:complete len:205 (-) comp12136_c0_seq2:1614-2228(-)
MMQQRSTFGRTLGVGPNSIGPNSRGSESHAVSKNFKGASSTPFRPAQRTALGDLSNRKELKKNGKGSVLRTQRPKTHQKAPSMTKLPAFNLGDELTEVTKLPILNLRDDEIDKMHPADLPEEYFDEELDKELEDCFAKLLGKGKKGGGKEMVIAEIPPDKLREDVPSEIDSDIEIDEAMKEDFSFVEDDGATLELSLADFQLEE